MNYKEINNKVIIENVVNFNIEEILECGQCFRFEKIAELEYKIVACDRVLHILQSGNTVELSPCTEKEFENIWYDYFDFSTDYGSIIEEISKEDEIMREAVKYGSGIRLLNQQPYECLLSFIISQNNNIPRIKKIIASMAECYGEKCGEDFLFPKLKALENASIDELMELKMGFRAKYIFDAVEKLKSKEVVLSDTEALSTEDLRERLISIKGVGQKVADCALLFSLKRRETFPTDVWIKRVMEHLYFNDEEKDIKTIHSYATEKWGKYCGFAQQYLFYYARSLKIGTEKEKKKK